MLQIRPQSSIKEHCFQLRLRWPDSPARLVCREVDYYNELIAHGRKTQAPFPYHLADYICRVLRISPFRYYSDLLLDVMKQEKSYDTIPNFTAADALRETGIGRNQFIDIMNRARAKLMWRVNRGIVKDMLPLEPVPFPIQPWWLVCVVNLTADEYRRLTEDELSVIERGGHEGDCMAGEFDDDLVRALHCKGLVYLDVPVYPNDRFRVSSLEGFVSNRNQQGEDASEKYVSASSCLDLLPLLPLSLSQFTHALSFRCCSTPLFVTASEQATVHEMALTLQADVRQLGAAISLACRLGWAEKVLDLHSLLDHMDMGGDGDTSDGGLGSEGFGAGDGGTPLPYPSLVPLPLSELKQHAVTLFEGGKLSERSVAELCGELRAVEKTRHSWRASCTDAEPFHSLPGLSPSPLPFIPCSPPLAPPPRPFVPTVHVPHRAEATRKLKQHAVTLFEAGKLSERSVAELCGELRAVEKTQLEGELQKFTDHTPSASDTPSASQPTSSHADSATAPDGVSGSSAAGSEGSRLQEKPLHPRAASYPALAAADAGDDDGSSSPAAPPPPAAATLPPLPPSSSSSSAAAAMSNRATFNRVEVLRTESLQGLAPATLHRLLRRDFDLVVSIVPLPKPLNAVVPDGSGPAHFAHPPRVPLPVGEAVPLRENGLWSGFSGADEGAEAEVAAAAAGDLLLRHSAVMIQPLAAPPAPAPGFSRTGSNSAARAAGGGGGGAEGGLWGADGAVEGVGEGVGCLTEEGEPDFATVALPLPPRSRPDPSEARAADGVLSQPQKPQGGGRSLGRTRLGGTETAGEAVGGAAGGDEGRRSEGVEGEG
ncbi:unnamed protein product, partial [Closterium sp. Naga37s-1]